MKWVRAARDRADLVALGMLVLVVLLLPHGVPGGIYGLGFVSGSVLALQAVGLVLVYRSNRIINFAQVQVGVVAGALFRLLVEQRTLLRGIHLICPPCFTHETGGWISFSYWTSLLGSLLVAVLLSYVMYTFVVKRFADAPRLVLTIATVGIAQLLGSLQAWMPGALATGAQRQLSQVPVGRAAPPPLDISFGWAPAIFRAPDVLAVLLTVAVIGALSLYFRSSRGGVAIRAAAENRQRAFTLGIDVDVATRRVWLMAGMLSGIAGILVAMSSPLGPPASLDVGITVRILAAAVLASMTSIPVAALAAVGLGIFDQAMLWTFQSTAVADGLLTGVIASVLLLQRPRVSRVEQELASAWRAAREVRPVPSELRGMAVVRRGIRIAAIGGAIAILAFPFVMSPTQTTVFTITFVYGIIGMSLLILSGWAGQISLGQFAFAGGGGYVAAMLSAHARLPLIACLIVAGVAGAVMAILVGLPALKMRGLHLAITTLAVALTTSSILLSPSHLGRYLPDTVSRGTLIGIDLHSQRAFYFFSLAILVLIVAATMGLRRSRIGRALIAARDNELAAQSFGTNLVRARLIAFAISGAIAAVAGALYVFHQNGLKPAAFTPDVSVLMFLMAVIGGFGSIAGPLIGALYLGFLNLLSVSPLVLFLATGGGVVVLLLLVPGGLGQFAADIRDIWLRRVARRAQIVVPSLLADTRATGERGRAPIAPHQGESAFIPTRYRVGSAP